MENYEALRANVQRVWERAALENDQAGIRILDIAPQVHGGMKPLIKNATLLTLDIDPNSGADLIMDLCGPMIVFDPFDAIVCTEVLEHTLEPAAAVDNIHKLLKPGGKAYITTPFNFMVHEPFPDMWRFTEHGLRHLFRNFSSCQVESIETPGRHMMPIQYTTIAQK